MKWAGAGLFILLQLLVVLVAGVFFGSIFGAILYGIAQVFL